MSAAHPIVITLTTDFGTADGYVGAMKGRLLSICPDAVLCDITHAIAPQHLWQAAWCLRRAVPHFPPGTVHLCVVDPGVGSARSGLVLQTERYLLVGPDNGVLTLAARDDRLLRAIEIDETSGAWRKSHSFDGLHLFAPVAAHLAAGMPLEEVGPEAEDLEHLPEREPAVQGNVVEGAIVLIDRYGNAISNIARRHVESRHIERVFLASGQEVMLCDHYAQIAGAQRPGALFNSDDLLEIALYGDSAHERLHLREGESVRVLLRQR